jgi:hypothetical protein
MWHSLGKVTVAAAGTPVIATTNETDPTKRFACQTVFFQQLESNTGKLYICDRATANKTTLVGVLAVIPAPTVTGQVATVLPWAQVSVPSAPAALNAAEFWIDADVSSESALVSAVRN